MEKNKKEKNKIKMVKSIFLENILMIKVGMEKELNIKLFFMKIEDIFQILNLDISKYFQDYI